MFTYCSFLISGYFITSVVLLFTAGAEAATNCTNLQWACVTRDQCIDQTLRCDGRPDCKDGSDETFHLCSDATFLCPEYAFKCTYGACVDGDSVCNGVTDCADNSDELFAECKGVVSTPKTHKCGALEFACLSGACIESIQICDGVKDCKDGSDETITQCLNFTCPEYAFRCAYGACVDGDLPCNGRRDCADGSDEYAPQCNVVGVPPLPGEAEKAKPGPGIGGGKRPCRLPKLPHGSYTFPSCESNCTSLAGTTVGRGTSLVYECDEGYSLRGAESQTCFDGVFLPKVQVRCSNGCDPLVSRKLEIACFSADSKVLPCNETLPYNSIAHFRCRETTHKAIESLGYSKLTCINGEWDKPFTDRFCRAVCGKAVGEFAAPHIIHGTPVRFGNFPWHAGIYKNDTSTSEWKFVCGGSIISPNIVISAAHCFKYNKPSERTLFLEDTKDMRIGLGKRYITLHDNRDNAFAQDYGINQVVILPEWTGSYDDYQFDISIIILDGQVIFSSAIQPICLDIDRNNDEEDQLVAGAVGMVPGWGLTESKEASDELLLAEMPYVDRQTCEKETKLFKYLKKDKICGGNKITKQTVCSGDSGGGYVFKDSKTNTFYLRGIVSVGTPNCKGDDYALFTKVSRYAELINQYYN